MREGMGFVDGRTAGAALRLGVESAGQAAAANS